MPTEVEPFEPQVIAPQPGADYSAVGQNRQPFAVLYEGDYETPWDGTAVAVRAHATALAHAGLPVLLKSRSSRVGRDPVHLVGISDEVRRQVAGIRDTSASVHFPLIRHIVVSGPTQLAQIILPRGAIGNADIETEMRVRSWLYASTIVYSVWERDRVDPEIGKQLSRVADNWVPCEQNRKMLIASGVPEEKVHVVPHPYDPEDPICLLTRRQANPENRRFYSIGRWEPRKAYHELIGAFLLAHSPGARAWLTIKYSGSGYWPDYPAVTDTLDIWAQHVDVQAMGWTPELIRTRVELIGAQLPRSRILKIHYENNIYVSSSHGEAWCLPAFEAKLAGNALVHIPWGGTKEFADESDFEVLFRMGPVHPSYGWERDACWAEFDINNLAAALRHCYAPKHHAPQLETFERFQSVAVGKLMRARVMEICSGKDAVLAHYQHCLASGQ